MHMSLPDLKSVTRFKTGWPNLKWATGVILIFNGRFVCKLGTYVIIAYIVMQKTHFIGSKLTYLIMTKFFCRFCALVCNVHA